MSSPTATVITGFVEKPTIQNGWLLFSVARIRLSTVVGYCKDVDGLFISLEVLGEHNLRRIHCKTREEARDLFKDLDTYFQTS